MSTYTSSMAFATFGPLNRFRPQMTRPLSKRPRPWTRRSRRKSGAARTWSPRSTATCTPHS